jgi:chromate transporter
MIETEQLPRPVHDLPVATTATGPVREVFRVFLLLGLTSFGGPIAHLGYFQEALVRRRRWLTQPQYADIVALCQVLPGPTSSQVGLMIGRRRAGVAGAFAAWLGFTVPSALLMTVFALGLDVFDNAIGDGIVRGLKTVAVAVVALAVWSMARTLWPDRNRTTVGLVAAIVVLVWPTALGQVVVIAAAAIVGIALFGRDAARGAVGVEQSVGISDQRLGGACLAIFATLLVGLPVLSAAVDSRTLSLFDGFYRAGALVFGGGHVVLPLLEAVVVPSGWVTSDEFTAGYGLVQAIPGPLFTFSTYLGAIADGGIGAVVALLAIFLPSFLLVFGIVPFWEAVRRRPAVTAALAGVNAAVVGILLAALYDPIWTSAIVRPVDLALAIGALLALAWWKLPPWLVVLAGALIGIVTP